MKQKPATNFDFTLELLHIIQNTSQHYVFRYIPKKALIEHFQFVRHEEALQKDFAATDNYFKHYLELAYGYTSKEELSFAQDFLALKENKSGTSFPFDPSDVFGKQIQEEWNKWDQESKSAFELCFQGADKSKPLKSWIKSAQEHLDQLANQDLVFTKINAALLFIHEKAKAIVRKLNGVAINRNSAEELMASAQERYALLSAFGKDRRAYYLSARNEQLVRYLLWYVSLSKNKKLHHTVGLIASSSFAKIREVGGLSIKTGNAALFAFTYMPEKLGIIQLLKIRDKSKNKNVQKIANKYLNEKAKALGLSQQALLEFSAPDFDLVDGIYREQLGEFEATIDTATIGRSKLSWKNTATARIQKSIPAKVKADFTEELKDLKLRLKSINEAYVLHSRRLENSYLERHDWSFANWKELYCEHPLLNKYARLLIWQFDEGATAILSGTNWEDAAGNEIEVLAHSRVRLWHPIYSSTEEISLWRSYLLAKEIKQPFKQAYREVYRVTEAEINTGDYSNRFAAHILHQSQFVALCKTRNWSCNTFGNFDGGSVPFREIPAFDCSIEFWVEGVQGALSEYGVYRFLASDQVRFVSGRQQMEMENVPALLFSEGMRDVDLFVGVCSIGNNAEWEDAQHRDYWHSYSFGELGTTAKNRKEVLMNIVPKLKIGNKCRFTKRFLEVDGHFRTYKIHYGSGNILMAPDDEYLCIVPDAKKKANEKLFLPFDDDKTLSIIISKAVLLANDKDISDSSITSQIKYNLGN